MNPNELVSLLVRSGSVADIVDAISNDALQCRRGWDLTRWHFQPIPWGVRLIYHGDDDQGEEINVILAVSKGSFAGHVEPTSTMPKRTLVFLG